MDNLENKKRKVELKNDDTDFNMDGEINFENFDYDCFIIGETKPSTTSTTTTTTTTTSNASTSIIPTFKTSTFVERKGIFRFKDNNDNYIDYEMVYKVGGRITFNSYRDALKNDINEHFKKLNMMVHSKYLKIDDFERHWNKLYGSNGNLIMNVYLKYSKLNQYRKLKINKDDKIQIEQCLDLIFKNFNTYKQIVNNNNIYSNNNRSINNNSSNTNNIKNSMEINNENFKNNNTKNYKKSSSSNIISNSNNTNKTNSTNKTSSTPLSSSQLERLNKSKLLASIHEKRLNIISA